MKQDARNNRPVRLPPKKKPDFDKWAVPLGAVISGGLVGLALPNLIDVSDVGGIAKVVLITGGATLASYWVNRFAINKGTELAARGYVTAGAASVFSMLFVGVGLFAASYSGLTLPDVEKLRLQEHGSAYTQFIGKRNLKAAEAGRALPVMRSIEGDLTSKVACEISISCVSGRGDGGRGTVALVLEDKAGRAVKVLEQLEAGGTLRRDALKRLNKLVGEYQSTLGASDKDIWQRRRELQKIDAQINQTISDLDEAIPVTFLRVYASELETGANIHERPVATRRLSAMLKKHGASLNSVLDTLEKGDQTRPQFPARTGVSDAFNYLGHFAPIGILTAGIELIWPLSLWIYTLLYLLWGNHLVDPRQPNESNRRSDPYRHRNGRRPNDATRVA